MCYNSWHIERRYKMLKAKYAEQLSMETLRRLNEIKEEAHHNQLFISTLESAIEYFLDNEGKVFVEGKTIKGTRRYNKGLLSNLFNPDEEKLLVTSGPYTGSLTVQINGRETIRPWNTKAIDNSSNIHERKPKTSNWSTIYKWYELLDCTYEFKVIKSDETITSAAQSSTDISSKNTETTMKFTEFNEEVSLVIETEQIEIISKLGSVDKKDPNAIDKTKITITRVGEYCFIEYIETINETSTNKYFVAQRAGKSLLDVASSKNSFRQIEAAYYDFITKGLITPKEVYERTLRKPN